MRWVPDESGDFSVRPQYTRAQIDRVCGRAISAVLLDKYGGMVIPVPTEALVDLIEDHARELDQYHDFADEGTEGATEFFFDRKPVVRIARALSEQAWCSHRRRTTLGHEAGHVLLQSILFLPESPARLRDPGGASALRYHRDTEETISGRAPGGWLEWQARYASGTILMPAGAMKRFIRDFLAEPDSEGYDRGFRIIERVADTFDVSKEAARVRLSQVGFFPRNSTFASR
jgi:hypothetical protein